MCCFFLNCDLHIFTADCSNGQRNREGELQFVKPDDPILRKVYAGEWAVVILHEVTTWPAY